MYRYDLSRSFHCDALWDFKINSSLDYHAVESFYSSGLVRSTGFISISLSKPGLLTKNATSLIPSSSTNASSTDTLNTSRNSSALLPPSSSAQASTGILPSASLSISSQILPGVSTATVAAVSTDTLPEVVISVPATTPTQPYSTASRLRSRAPLIT